MSLHLPHRSLPDPGPVGEATAAFMSANRGMQGIHEQGLGQCPEMCTLHVSSQAEYVIALPAWQSQGGALLSGSIHQAHYPVGEHLHSTGRLIEGRSGSLTPFAQQCANVLRSAIDLLRSGDHTVKIICHRTGQCLKVLSGHRRTPWVVRFHPKQPHIVASGSLDYEVIHLYCTSGVSLIHECWPASPQETLSIASPLRQCQPVCSIDMWCTVVNSDIYRWVAQCMLGFS